MVEHRRGPAKIFRLTIGKTELPGLWICVGRKIIALGEASAACGMLAGWPRPASGA